VYKRQANNWWRDFVGAPHPGTWYPQALANSLRGQDVSPESTDITATFNSNINGDPDCIGGASWYYGLDGNPPAGDYDFVTVVMHEIGHGLGFQTVMNVQTGALPFGDPDGFIRHLEREGATPSDYPSMNDAQRAAANVSDPHLRWVGGHVTYMIPGLGVFEGLNGNYVRMHAPSELAPGSSVAHFSVDVEPDEVMEPFYAGANHDPGLALHLLHDIGWQLDSSVSVLFEQLSATTQDAAVELRWRYRADEPVIGFRVYRRQIGGDADVLASEGLLPASTDRFLDRSVRPAASYRYAVAAVTRDGAETRSPTVTVAVAALVTELAQNLSLIHI
jgi:hypothetical protein